ncbi:hypothetical protein D3C71_341720 [compost metagenome]
MTVINFKVTVDDREFDHKQTDVILVEDCFGLIQMLGFLIGLATGFLHGYNKTCADVTATARPVARVILSGEFTEEERAQVKRGMEHMLNVLKKQAEQNQTFIEIEDLTFKIYF